MERFFRILDGATYVERRKLLKKYAAKYPRLLYKFRRLQTPEDTNHLREIIIRSELWLSSPNDFNDPFDMSVKFLFDASSAVKRARIRKVLQDQGMKFREIERVVPRMVSKLNAENLAKTPLRTISETGVCSFAGDPRNILMWSHYAANHEGLCLAFEIAGDPRTFLDALPVEYSVEYPVVNWVTDFDKNDITKIVLRKHKGWEYEKERRIIKLKNAHTRIKFRPEALRAIITGCRMKDDTLEKLKTLLEERITASMPAIKIYHCYKHESRYELVISKSLRFNTGNRSKP